MGPDQPALFPELVPELPRPGQQVRWSQPWHAHAIGWADAYGPGPFEVVRVVDKAEQGLPAGVVLKTGLGEREINAVWLELSTPSPAPEPLRDVAFLQQPIGADELVAEVARPVAPRGPEILVVEDEPWVLRMLDVALRQDGFAVRLAGSGTEAIDVYRRHRRAISLVLLDVQMPGLDGPRTLAALRKLDPHVRSCFMSGHAGMYSTEDLLALGAARVFPISSSTLTI